MLRIEEDCKAASKSTRDFLESQKVNATNSSSAETLTVDFQDGLNFENNSSETYKNDYVSTKPLQESRDVTISQEFRQNNGPVPVPIKIDSIQLSQMKLVIRA